MSFPITLSKPLVVFDLETTGLFPRKDRVVEIAAVKVYPDGHEQTLELLLNPTVRIPPETTAIHGITDELVKECPTFREKAEEILEFFRGCDVSGFNSDRYDLPCLEEEFARVGKSLFAVIGNRVDVQRIYHKMEPRNLSSAVKYYCNRSLEGAHGALADARGTLDVLKAQLMRTDGAYAELQGKSIAELDSYLAPRDPLNADKAGMFRWRDGVLYVNFGKKKGESLKNVMLTEPRFLKWIVNGDFEPEVKSIAREALEGRLPPPPQG